ncbi:hypothetical protein K1B48_08075 [Lactobacillus johnsonii]|uniref:hypothetical protein n=1 Tax=Lactobacillus johnsonii TaxID=33959 RepID=UPI000F87025E|nr:hypothetical protein [Lactobacillus johnsonii]MBW8461101.1 hypothetical protein [Lactobacillus johnsonii]RST61846.1 hypothetical protein EIZ77_08140 [Bifidobacterium animalis subsp. lactis]
MVSKKDIGKLFKQKHFTGHQVGRILLDSLLDQLYDRTPKVSDEEIAKMKDHLANEYEGSIYDTYVNIYAGLVDMFNYVQMLSNNAMLNLVTLKGDLSLLSQATLDHQMKINEPVTITERQFRRYETKYRKYLKETSDQHKKQKILVFHYLQERLKNILDESSWEDTDKETFWKKYPHIKEILDQYDKDHNSIPVKSNQYIQELYRKYHKDDSSTSEDLKRFAFFEAVNTSEHDEELQNQIKSKHLNLSLKELKTYLLKSYLSERYENNLSKDDASEQAFKDNDIYLQYFDNLKNSAKVDDTLPDHLTKKDLLDNWIFDIPSIHFDDNTNTSTTNKINTENIQSLDQILAKELFDIFKATAQDLSALTPDIKEILTFNDPKELLNKKTTQGILAKKGDNFYKDYISITWLRSEDDYGMWQIFPKKYQHQARFHGFSVYHDPSNDTEEDHFTKLADQDEKNFFQRIEEYTSDQQVEERYDSIEKFITLYQAYNQFINGVIAFSNDMNLGEFKKAPAYREFLNEIDRFHAIRNLSLYELEDMIRDKKLLKDTQKRIIDGFPLIDLSKPRFKQNKPEDIASYIARIFSQEDSKPISTVSVLDDIVRGDIDAKEE